MSEKLVEDFRKKVNLCAGALALLTVEQPFDDEEWRCLPSFLNNIYHEGEFKILHHKLNYVVVHMDSQDTFRKIGNAIAENSGLNVIEDKRITSLEGKRSIVVYEWRKQSYIQYEASEGQESNSSATYINVVQLYTYWIHLFREVNTWKFLAVSSFIVTCSKS